MTDQTDDPLAGAHLDTLAIRAGIARTAEGEHAEPIFATSSYVFDSAAEAAARFGGDEAGNVYSRYTNPTVRTFEQRIAALEGGEAAVGTASGMAAILSTAMALLKAGDHVVAARDVCIADLSGRLDHCAGSIEDHGPGARMVRVVAGLLPPFPQHHEQVVSDRGDARTCGMHVVGPALAVVREPLQVVGDGVAA